MRAIEVTAYGDSAVMEPVERGQPEPGPGEVRVAVEAAGVNFADIMQRRGHYHGGPEAPFVPGLEVAGTVDAVGEGVGREVGERVVTMVDEGGYAEYAIADAAGLLPVPEGLSMTEAAGYPVQFLTAHNCLHGWGELEAGESVLIHAAAGGVGTAAVQLAREAGAEVFGTASTAKKLERVVELGCDHPINYEQDDFVAAVEAETDHGVDMVLDGVGGETTARSLEALSHFGRMVVYGAASGMPGRLQTDDVLFGNYQIVGYHLGRALQLRPMEVLAAVPELSEMLESGDLVVQFDRAFDLSDAAAAHEYIESRRSIGKVVVEP
ncbi:MAG: NADPH:quinone reductase related Zn-dependent oxidoreductase [halophilic archaeon J07HX64]|jgi:NADPH:quinone reductase and related Zn-dependent oxidoreductases|nr:MAG: NADPH:quinone reductase related Zn-dependent oxidoreductase [halophilic archaeon J07HX64]